MIRPATPVEHRVALIVGGNFTADALGPAFDDVLAAVAQAPADHLAAFERLYLAPTVDTGRFADLQLPAFLAIVAPLLPTAATRAAATLAQRFTTVARQQNAEMREATEASIAGDVARRRRRLIARRDDLTALMRPR